MLELLYIWYTAIPCCSLPATPFSWLDIVYNSPMGHVCYFYHSQISRLVGGKSLKLATGTTDKPRSFPSGSSFKECTEIRSDQGNSAPFQALVLVLPDINSFAISLILKSRNQTPQRVLNILKGEGGFLHHTLMSGFWVPVTRSVPEPTGTVVRLL